MNLLLFSPRSSDLSQAFGTDGGTHTPPRFLVVARQTWLSWPIVFFAARGLGLLSVCGSSMVLLESRLKTP